MHNWKTLTSDRWTIYDEPDREKTAPLQPLAYTTLQGVFQASQSEWATNSLFTIYRKQWTPTTFTYEVYVYGGRVHIANNIEDDLQAFLTHEYDRHVQIDFDEYFEKENWYKVSEPVWKQGGDLW